MAGWWQRLFGSSGSGSAGPRVAGDPPSANGASSFHLRWDLSGTFEAASVTLEVLEPPAVDRLYFWALQADVVDDRGRPGGGAHLGLQWYPPHPGSTAVNWGGYDRAGRVLDGTDSPLPSATGNANTRDLSWGPGRPYRLSITRSGPGPDDRPGTTRWAGSVEDDTGRALVVRELFVPGTRISGLVTWSEVFARCDHPGVAVRWSRPEAVGVDGSVTAPPTVSLNYQAHADGGCANTDSSADGIGVVQRTATTRLNPQGATLTVPS